MEPSLRSSTQRGNECKLRKTDPAAHETTKRFVESLRSDVRISQYADLAFAGKKMEESNEPWYWLEPVPGGRTGFLVLLPDQPAVWIDEQGKVSFYVQMRVSVPVYEKRSVFLASLNKFDGLLRLEDVWVLAGKSFTQSPFTQRWDALMTFYGVQYKEDFQLQQGLRLEMASYSSLGSVKGMSSVPATMFLQGEKYPRRLRVQMEAAAGAAVPIVRAAPAAKPLPLPLHTHTQTQKHTPIQKPMFVDDEDDVKQPPFTHRTTPDDVARAIAHEEHPDTYNLWINGVKKGYAAVQDLDLSRELRTASKDDAELYVKVEWNSEFNMYEIVSKA
jgi:hypothetical protein